MHKGLLSNWQVALLSVGGMIGSGWLFAPYFVFQSVGIVGALFAWATIAVIATVIALSFAEVISILPISGAMTRFLKVTHGNTMTFLMIICGWISYIVIVPLEAQATIRYLSFWVPSFSVKTAAGVELTLLGTMAAFAIIIALTWLNTLIITKVANTNSAATLWKILVPSGVVLFVIFSYGCYSTFSANVHAHPLVVSNAFGSISKDGLGFSLLGFQNGLLLSKLCRDRKKGMVYSLFVPLILATVIYMGLSLMFSFVANPVLSGTTAPLLGLVFSLGIQWLVILLFVDAIVAPLGAGNVYITFAGRILYGFAREYMPNGRLAKLNVNEQPASCLWINALIACIFLLPFPTWRALANFFASIIALMYLAGPIALIVLRDKTPEFERTFRVKWHVLVGYLGFIGCSLLIFWSGAENIKFLTILLAILYALFVLFRAKANSMQDLFSGALLVTYCAILWLIAMGVQKKLFAFPHDLLIVSVASIILCYLLVKVSLPANKIVSNINELITADADAV